ncbi:MAG: nucleotidyltransferase domain-containing protein [Methanosphaera stadtmanae]|nr:nucleotidyltransferase domain-containing protein [Methanosphaera stadtmanae]
MHNRLEIAKNFAKSIKSDYIQKIIVYGSVARGDDKEDSDIDILIISDNYEAIEDMIADEVINIIFEENEYISTCIISNAQFEKTKNFSFLTNVLNEGVTIG